MGRIINTLAVAATGLLAFHFLKRKEDILPAGESSQLQEDRSGVNRDPIPIFYYRPVTWTEDEPVFIAFPGYTRRAESYEKHLEELAVKYNMLIASPEFSMKKFPDDRWYQEGNMIDKEENGTIQPRKEWTFSAVNHVISAVRKKSRAKGKVILFGHSAGGQLMHRFSLFAEENGADEIVCANSGWFTMPDEEIPFPYGTKDLPLTDRDYERAFARPVTMLMGGKDISRKKPFRDTKESDAQGLNRMERCNNYFHACEAKAHALSVPFLWKLGVVEGSAHEGVKMAEGAMKLFATNPLDETKEL